MRHQPRLKRGKRTSIYSGLPPKLQAFVNAEVRHWKVSRSYVCAQLMADAAGIDDEQADYRNAETTTRRRARLRLVS